MPAGFTAHPGKAAMQIPAVQILVDHIHDMGPPKTKPGRIPVVPNALQVLEMIFHAFVIAAVFGLARVIHIDLKIRSWHGNTCGGGWKTRSLSIVNIFVNTNVSFFG